MRNRLLIGTLLVLAVTGFVWGQPERPKVFIGLGGEPGDEGIVIRDVTADSPAAKAGLKPGDVIVKIGDKVVKGFETMGEALAGKNPGDKLSLTAKREGKEQVFELTLAAPSAGAVQPRPAAPQARGGFLGVMLQELSPDLKSKLGVTVDKGALIADVVPNSPAAKADLKEGDVITALDGNPVESAQALREAIQRSGAGKKVSFKVARGDKMMDMTAHLEEMTPDRIAPRTRALPLQAERPTITAPADRIRELERKLQELEKRLAELEKKGAKP
jgi:S1-C subfamily serine protease